MPVTPTFPGVYVEEIPSGVRTITGVSTSVTAFVGFARRGRINKATRLLSFADFERRFGGLDVGSELSYAVRQFFLNGGGEAWVVRIAEGPTAAFRELRNASGDPVLRLTALDEGSAGNEISVAVDYSTDNPGSTFNLTLALVPAENPSDAVFETFRNLSMNSADARYVQTIVEARSELVKAERSKGLELGTARGISESGRLSGDADNFFKTLIDATHNKLRLAIDGEPPVDIAIAPAVANTLDSVRASIAAKLPADVKVAVRGDTLVLTSATTGERSSVRVLPGEGNDVASRLHFGPLFGGVEIDAVVVIRPVEMPSRAAITGGVIDDATDLNTIPSVKKSLRIMLSGLMADITLDGPDLAGDLTPRLTDLASRLETKVRAAKAAHPAFKGFNASLSGGNRLVLQSGLRGAVSTIQVTAVAGDTLADDLQLIAPAADLGAAEARDDVLGGGSELPINPDNLYNLIIADRSQRRGLFALEGVDLFNILVIPGVSDPGILMDAAAYCVERRAFLICEPAPDVDKVEEMEQAVTGTAFPKSKNAAVYFPWIKVADPLRGGALRSVAPGGTIAGLYSRIDGARGVWKAPAGTDATLAGVQSLAYVLSDRENGVLNPRGVNCVRLLPVFGPVSWGARTLHGDDQMTSEWKYVPIRRLALFIEESLYRGTQWVVFEPNDEPLWAQIRLNIGAFMQNLFRQGAFQGKSPREAYFVKCDGETTTQNDINLGIVNIVVGFAPLKPAEFVIIKLQQMAGQIAT